MANETVNSADSGATRQAAIIGISIAVVALSVLFFTHLKSWLCENAWFHSALVDGPAVVVAILAWRELGHSREANKRREELVEELNGTKTELGKQTEEAKKANDLRKENNDLARRNAELTERLATSQQRIADNLEPKPTRAERNASILQNHMRKNASVATERMVNLPTPYELVELKDGVLTLFSPASQNGTSAIYRRVDCEDLSIDENPHGGCAIRINVTKYQGLPVDLGQVTKWEDRFGDAPVFDKAPGVACNASYGKGGSAETKTLNIFQARDGSNSFQLESSDGWATVGDNVDISKRFMANQIDYLAANFTRNTFRSGGTNGGHSLFVC
jgi:hypothetical protein